MQGPIPPLGEHVAMDRNSVGPSPFWLLVEARAAYWPTSVLACLEMYAGTWVRLIATCARQLVKLSMCPYGSARTAHFFVASDNH